MVEVIVILAIIGVLTSIAIPVLSDYRIRKNLDDAISAAAACRASIARTYQSRKPPETGKWGCGEVASAHVSNLTTDVDGAVTLTVRNISPAVDGLKIRMAPLVGGVPATVAANLGEVISAWSCGPAESGGVDRRYLPDSCRD